MRLIWLVCTSVVASLSAAQVESGAGAEQPYRVTRWTTDQGLPQNRISCLKQARDGYLWLGTWFGLARFDGARFSVFDKYNTPELVNDAINAVAEDTDGTLWIATAAGLVSYRDYHFHRLTTADGLPDRKVWRLAACCAGGVWLQAGNSVTRLAGGKFSRGWAMPVSDANSIQALQAGTDGSLHIVMTHTWLTLSPNALELRTNQVANSSGYAWLTGLSAKRPGRLWVGTQQGLQRWDQGVAKTIEADELGQRSVDFLYEDRFTNLWVNTKLGGLFREDQAGWTAVGLGDHAAPVSTTCMEEDREGNLWLGTDQGLVQLQKRRVRAYTTRDGLADDSVWSVCEGTDGTIWIGANRGLSRIQNGRVMPLDAGDVHPDCPNRCVWPARDGGVWIAKPGIGIFEFRERLTQRVAARALPNPNLFALYEDRSHRLWIGTGNGVAIVEGGQITATYTNWAGQSGFDVRCILEDRAGTFWFGTQGQGLTRMRDGKFEVFTKRDGLSNNRVWSIHEDGEGALWLGTEHGLNRFVPPRVKPGVPASAGAASPSATPFSSGEFLPAKAGTPNAGGDRFFSFTRKDGLLENAVNWILEDDFGYLWLSGLRGIYRVQREQLNAVAEGRAPTVQVAAFGTADGMESSESNGEGQPAGWKARDGRLWFPTARGVVVIDPKTIEVNDVPPPVVIEQIKADDEVIFGGGVAAGVRKLTPTRSAESGPQNESQSLLTSAATVRLAPGRAQVLEISYTANTFVDPKRARFRYRLVGRDSGWREVTTERVAHYTNLRPGEYRFEVIAANHHGVWSPGPASFTFSLAPKFSQTIWFPLSWALALLAVSAAIVTWRLRWQRRAFLAEKNTAVERERGRIARNLHDDLGASLTGVALQLEAARRVGRAEGDQLGELASEARAIAHNLRELSWTTNPRCDNAGSLGVFLGELAERFCAATGLECKLELPPANDARVVPARVRYDLLVLVKELLANVVKHASARTIALQVVVANGQLQLTVHDDGAGFDPTQVHRGSGLRNLRERLEQAHGNFTVTSAPTQGTVITAAVPLDEPKET